MKHVDIYIKNNMRSMKENKARYAYILVYKLANGDDFKRTGTKEIHSNDKNIVTKNSITLMAIVDAITRMQKTVDCTFFIDNYHVYNMIQNDMPRKWKAHDFINAKGKQLRDTGKWQTIWKFMNNNFIHMKREEYPEDIEEQLQELLAESVEE